MPLKKQAAEKILVKHHHFINRAIKALLIISGIFMFAFAMFSPIYAIFVEEIGGGIEVAANSWAIFGLVAGIFTFIFGKFENEMKETELSIAWAQFVCGLGYLLLYFTDNTTMLYIDMIILGLAEAFYWPAFHSVYAKHAEGKKSTFLWGIYDGMAYFVPAIGSALGGWIVAAYGFGPVFLIMSGLSFLCGVFIVVLPRKVL